jgi:hypothetical protein
MKRWVVLVAALAALFAASCSDDDGGADTSPAVREKAPAPDEGSEPSPDAGQLPPEFLECMAENGFEVDSSADIHSAPPQVLQECFGSIH